MTENIAAGLISGILATFLVFVFSSIWKGLIVPWFEERIYKDARIEGNWFSLYPTSNDDRQEVISLQRHGHAITGTITCVAGGDIGEKYIIQGSFRNLLLPLTYESADLTKTDRGTITLQSVYNGERFVGKLAYYNTIEDAIHTGNTIWFRSKQELDKFILIRDRKRKIFEEIRRKSLNIEKELKTVENEDKSVPSENVATVNATNSESSANNG